MKIEREILEDKLKDIIKDYAKNRKVVQQVTQELINKNMLEGDISSIFKFTTPISNVNDFVLYVFTKAMFKATKEIRIDPTTYFTKIEIEDGDKWKQETIKEQDKEPVVFRDCIKINNNTWLTTVTNKDLYNMFNVRTLVYNVKTQRPLITREKANGNIIERIDINPKAVHEIESLIKEDLFIPDPFTINALYNENLNMEENEKARTVTFFSGELNLTDGNHRMRGEFKALVNNPTLIRNIPILLTRLTEERAKDYIFQKSQHNPLNADFKKTINPTRLSNQIIDFLNTEKKSLLKGRITKDSSQLKAKGSKAVVEFNTLADSIDLTFNPKQQTELFAMNKFIMNGLNHIINVFDILLKDYSEAKTWCMYICMLYAIKDMDDWETILDNLLLDIDIKDVQFKAINKVSVKNIMAEIKPLLPIEESDEEGVDENGE